MDVGSYYFQNCDWQIQKMTNYKFAIVFILSQAFQNQFYFELRVKIKKGDTFILFYIKKKMVRGKSQQRKRMRLYYCSSEQRIVK